MRVLVTSGATREPIDGVRFISNISTGRTGAQIADALARRGHSVVYLHGIGTTLPEAPVETVGFSSFLDLADKMQSLLHGGQFNAVVHSAAVSDYSVRHIRMRNAVFPPSEWVKLDSQHDVELVLSRNFKIFERLKEYAAPALLLVIAFKLTNTGDEIERKKAVEAITAHEEVDYVVHNDVREIAGESHRAHIYRRDAIVAEVTTKTGLQEQIIAILNRHAAR
jgi:phosphopantothenoylcysteine decarboxylase/phosphopantothenate--cysteine ligase